ncbi:MAG: helix-turn-helix domain-containing protein [Lachnospirales bacterium]
MQSNYIFYLSTNLSIITVQHNGNTRNAYGYKDYHYKLLDHTNILQMALDTKFDDVNKHLSLSFEDSIGYTILLKEPKNHESNIYILGPYSTIEKNKNNLPYKPNDVIKISVELLKKLDCHYNFSNKYNDTPHNSYHIQKALSYIEENYSKNINSSTVADYLNINKTYFCNLLKKETNKTFSELLNEIRIKKSKGLLLNNNYSIIEVAIACGYNNQNYYNIAFKKNTGITPTCFRNRKLNKLHCKI